MKRLLIILVVLIVLFSCSNNTQKETKDTTSESSELTKLEIPDNYEELISSEGDLDGDGNDERVIVFDTGIDADFGTEREVFICKKENDEWMLWKKLKGPVMSSESGGVAGDSFNDLIIDKGKIYISHMGGSMEKWYYNHIYEYIDSEFRLVTAVVDYGINCVKWETYHYELRDAKLIYDLAPDECDDVYIEEYCVAIHEEYDLKKIDLLLMDGFEPGNNELKLSDRKEVIYY
ncbi:MAG: hypothetical protein PHH30_09390 [Bacteroidales bacterium]|nr:hypothetical protein [Bacteroidales bacterium]